MRVSYRELGELVARLRRVARLGTCGDGRTEKLARQCAELIEVLYEYIKEPGPIDLRKEIDICCDRTDTQTTDGEPSAKNP